MVRVPNWCRWLLGSLTGLTLVVAAILIPAIQQARHSAMKSQDK